MNTWYKVRVKKVQPKLGHGFRTGQVVYCRPRETDFVVFNGVYAIRELTEDEAKAHVETVRENGKQVQLTDRELEQVEDRYQFELWR